tara:strand:+ start:1796 stop:5437 length:3642 start_codon:yes stop_codon:yes gene_type:complete
VSVDTSGLRKGIKESNKTIGEWAKNAQRDGLAVDRTFGNLQKRILQFASIHFASQIGGEIIKVRGEFQQLGIAFETMLGSKAKADQIMSEAITFAQKTPFTLTDVASNIKQLMAMGIATEKVMDTMKSLGDVAAGVSVPLQRVAINYGQVATLGVLQGREVRDFAMAGIPLIDELAKNLGKAKNEIQEMVSAGQIGFKDVEKAFQTMAGEGGKFYNLMEKQNASVTGQISNLQDKLQVMFNSIGKANEGLIYGGISGLSDLVENYQEVLDVLKLLVITYGTYRAALISVTAIQKLSLLATQVQEYIRMSKALGMATANMIAFNRASLVNPYVAAAAGVGLLIGALFTFSEKAKTAEDRIEELNDSISQIGKQQEINGLIKKYDELKDKTELTDDEQKELNSTIQELSTIFPDAISQVDKYGKAIDVVREKLVANNKELQLFLENSTKQEIFEGQKKLDELIATRDRLVKELNTGTGERSFGTGGLAGGTTKKTVDLTKSELAQNKEDLDNIIKDIDGLASKLTESQRKLLELGSITAEESLKPYKDLFKELGEYTTKQLYDTKAKLTALLSEGFGADAEAKIKQQIDSIASKLGEPTIKQQIEATTKALEDAQKKLTDLRGPDSQASVKQIEEQETAVEELVKKLELLTGVKKKSAKEVDDLKKQIDKLYQDLETADEADRQIIAARILYLERELSLRQAIAGEAMKIARNKTIDPVGLNVNSIRGLIKDSSGRNLKFGKGEYKVIKKVELEFDKLNKRIKETSDESLSMQDVLSGSSEVFRELAGSVRESNPDLADTIDNLGMLTNIGANLASGNYFAAAATGVQLLAASYKQALDTSKEENRIAEKWEDFEKWISLSNRELKQYIKLRDEAIGSSRYGGSDVLIDETKANIEETQKLLDELDLSFTLKGEGFFGNPYNDIEKKVQQTIDTLGGGILELEGNLKEWGVGFWKKVKGVFSYDLSQLLYDENGTFTTDKINELINEGIITDQAVIDAVDSYVELTDQLIEAEKNKQELLTATAASNIADSIIDGFSQGYDSAADFASNFENLMKDAVLNALKIQVLEEPLKDWYDAFAQAVESDGKLTSGEVSDLETWYNSIIESGLENFDRLSKLTGLDFGSDAASQAGLSGAIRREMTEETAGELAGIWRRTTDDTRQIRDYTKTGINHLVAIEANTFNTVVELQKAVSKLDTLDEIAANTKPAQTSRDLGL